MNVCLNCGKTLDKYQKKYCSISCENSYKHKLLLEHYNTNPTLCTNCGKPLNYKQHKQGNKFCSKNCSASYNNKLRKPYSDETKQKTSISLKLYNSQNKKLHFYVCKVCGKEYNLQRGINTKIFCSKECSNYYKKHRKEFLSEYALLQLSNAGRKSACVQGETRRSKNEHYFYELCSMVFKNVAHNECIFNGWDADIIIHDIKFAVLWNGVWHYKQIKKNTSLRQIQNRDKIKIEEILKYGYTPYIIKDMGKYNPNFVEQEFKKFKEYIKNIAGSRSGISADS